jgi:hypothetical protein
MIEGIWIKQNIILISNFKLLLCCPNDGNLVTEHVIVFRQQFRWKKELLIGSRKERKHLQGGTTLLQFPATIR